MHRYIKSPDTLEIAPGSRTLNAGSDVLAQPGQIYQCEEHSARPEGFLQQCNVLTKCPLS
jgi:hypothetical protein